MERINLFDYLDKKRKIKPTTKARNYMEEIALRYVDKFNWQTETLISDERFFWSSCQKFWKGHTPAQFEKILQWAAKVGAHPRGIANLLKNS